MKKTNSALFIIVFGFICIYSFINILIPDKEFSENENKYLAKMPALTWTSLVDGSFSQKYEKYISEQFMLRDEWISTKSVAEYALLKTENNGIVYGKDGYMFPKFYSFNADTLKTNLESVDTFSFNSLSNVYVMVVPSSYYSLVDKLPTGVPVVDESYFIDEINNYVSNSATPVSIKDVLAVNYDKYIYYRTDHHWTTYGAWLAYSQFASVSGLSPTFNYNTATSNTVEGFLGTSYSKSKLFNAQPDTIEYFDFNGTLKRDDTIYDGLYDLDKFQQRDKYSGFLYGNSGYTEIETDFSVTKNDSILIIRDSYADSFVPFLTEHYNKIVLVDPRYYNGSYKELANTPFSDVLILFGFEDFCSEISIAKLGTLDE